MADLHIERINELYHKSQKEGLTEEEKIMTAFKNSFMNNQEK